MAPFLPDAEKLAALRGALPATGAGIYLDTPTCGPLPQETAAAMRELQEWELRVGRGGPVMLEESAIRYDEARATAAAVITAGPDEIALTHGAIDGFARALAAVDLRPGDRVLWSTLGSPAWLEQAGWVASRRGAELALVDAGLPAVDSGAAGGPESRPTVESIEAAFERELGIGRSRLVIVPHVSPQTGAVLPIARLAELAHAAGAVLVVDGTQAAGAMPVAVEALGVDAYVVTAETWLLGPQGVGALWLGSALRADARPAVPGEPGPEGSGHALPAVVGFARSCSWLSMGVGLDWIFERTARLGAMAHELLGAVEGVHVLTPRDAAAGVVTFRTRGWPADQALDEVGRRAFAIASVVPSLDAIRIGTACFTTEAELGRLRDAVAEFAAYTPDTLPRRQPLTMLGEIGR